MTDEDNDIDLDRARFDRFLDVCRRVRLGDLWLLHQVRTAYPALW